MEGRVTSAKHKHNERKHKSALIPPVDFELDFKISLRSFASSFWMSSNDEISILLY